jgi:hypothetical protein
MSEWINKASDIEIVEKFQGMHDRQQRVRSLWGYRTQMKTLYPRLLKILLDGLQHEQECKPTHNEPDSEVLASAITVIEN